MTLKDITNTLTFTFDFFNQSEAVAIPSGDITAEEDIMGSYVAAAYLESGAALDLLLMIGKTYESAITIGIRCPVGNIEGLYPVDPNDLPWQMWPNEILPKDYPCFPLAEQAFALAKQIIDYDENINEYLRTGCIQSFKQRNLAKAFSLGLPDSAWPYHYVITALQFFSLDINSLQAYLPSFLPDMYYEAGGSFRGVNPLFVLLAVQSNAIIHGITWNEWIFANDLIDKTIETDFKNLAALIEHATANEHYDLMSLTIDWDYWAVELLPCQQAARDILTRLGWPMTQIIPIYTARQVIGFDEVCHLQQSDI